jgi:hypothetical protein
MFLDFFIPSPGATLGCERALVNEKEKEPQIVWRMAVWPRLFADRPPGSQEVNDE